VRQLAAAGQRKSVFRQWRNKIVEQTAQQKMEHNKKVVMDFYNLGLNKKDYEAASKYLGPRYVQHNPLVADGKEGFKNFLAKIKAEFPDNHNEIKRIFADGDYVIIHVHSVRIPGTRGRAIFDLFKLEDGKIVEHWDAIQEIPETSANPNGMF
jgi:predicted SnoaL-like aldol condensation-catalyzing enzyme